jgi:hypothetical protein
MTERYGRFVHKEIRTQTEEETGRIVTDEILASVIVVSVGSCQNGS